MKLHLIFLSEGAGFDPIRLMISSFRMDQVLEITRRYAEMATQGPGGIGGRFTEQELEEVMSLVFDKLKESFSVDLRSEMPEDRMHPKYMSEQ